MGLGAWHQMLSFLFWRLSDLINPDLAHYIALYLRAVALDGDYRNDWITHLPPQWHDWLMQLGMTLARALGFL